MEFFLSRIRVLLPGRPVFEARPTTESEITFNVGQIFTTDILTVFFKPGGLYNLPEGLGCSIAIKCSNFYHPVGFISMDSPTMSASISGVFARIADSDCHVDVEINVRPMSDIMQLRFIDPISIAMKTEGNNSSNCSNCLTTGPLNSQTVVDNLDNKRDADLDFGKKVSIAFFRFIESFARSEDKLDAATGRTQTYSVFSDLFMEQAIILWMPKFTELLERHRL